jgi:hypothetical protein
MSASSAADEGGKKWDMVTEVTMPREEASIREASVEHPLSIL